MSSPINFAEKITEEIAVKIESMEQEIAQLTALLVENGTLYNDAEAALYKHTINFTDIDAISNKN